ncbi:MAG TPA: tetratricopeptide repeat protein [candidate division Zixibacteria bacterium]|nr:tetratricopeptide repeat protein [candidate division Zixibacteria bacterium]
MSKTRSKTSPPKTSGDIPFDIEELIDRAERYLVNDELVKINDLLDPYSERIIALDDKSEQSGRLKAMLCEGWLYDKKYGDVIDRFAAYVNDKYPGPLNLALAKAYWKMRDWANALQQAELFLSGWEEAPSQAACRRTFEACLTAGRASLQIGRQEKAREYLERCVLLNPTDQRIYLELIQLYRDGEDIEAAGQVAEVGTQLCSAVEELRMTQKVLKQKATVSACMMVKNEEELLPGALESVRDWVDEIIVVDTGSTDNTCAIAESYGAKLFHQPWENNFSKHRNYTLELATSDWVFIIDADERVNQKEVPLLLDLINSDEHEIISINVFNLYGRSDHRITCANSVRLWRRKLDFRYEGIVHNSLQVPEGSHITRAPISLEHLGYDLSPEKMQAKFERTMALLEEQITKNPDNGFAWFNVTQALRGRLDENDPALMQRAREAALKAVRLNDPDVSRELGLHVMSLNHVGWIAIVAGDLEEAEEYALRALSFKPDYLDPLLLLGNVESRKKNYEQAIVAYQKYLDTQATYNEHRETLPVILYHPDSRGGALYGQGLAAESLGRREDAAEFYRRALEHTPGYLQAALRLGNIYLKENKLPEARAQFEAQLASRQPAGMAAAGIGYICALQNNLAEAETYYLKAVELEPNDLTVLTNAGLFFAESGDLDRARQMLEQVISIDENQPQLTRRLAEVCFEAGDFARARDLYQSLVERNWSDAALINDLGNCHYRLEDYDHAVACYLQATETEEAPAHSLRNLGLARFRQGQPEQAIAALESYLAVEPDDLQAVSALGELYIITGQPEHALVHFERFLQANPNDTEALFKLAECYKAMGHNDSAAMGYRRALQINPDFAPARQRLTEIAKAAKI